MAQPPICIDGEEKRKNAKNGKGNSRMECMAQPLIRKDGKKKRKYAKNGKANSRMDCMAHTSIRTDGKQPNLLLLVGITSIMSPKNIISLVKALAVLHFVE